ncbi:MAG: sugar 3,4-ketoisomerase [Verrucomicrobiota bacterium]
MHLELRNFTPRGDHVGWLIPIENQREVPFTVQRIYYIYGTQPGITRGKHAHRTLSQMAVCLQGSCHFQMDDGRNKQEIVLNRRDCGLMIEPMIWHEMNEFSPDCLLLVLASDRYDEKDYIRNYSEFIELATGKPEVVR